MQRFLVVQIEVVDLIFLNKFVDILVELLLGLVLLLIVVLLFILGKEYFERLGIKLDKCVLLPVDRVVFFQEILFIYFSASII